MKTNQTPAASESRHTPGTLFADFRRSEIVLTSDNGDIATVFNDERSENAGENAKRLAACWNALDGLNPAAIGEVVAALKRSESELASYEVAGSKYPEKMAVLKSVRSALAALKGGGK